MSNEYVYTLVGYFDDNWSNILEVGRFEKIESYLNKLGDWKA